MNRIRPRQVAWFFPRGTAHQKDEILRKKILLKISSFGVKSDFKKNIYIYYLFSEQYHVGKAM